MPLAIEVERRGAAAIVAYATNLSSSGVCLHVSESLHVGDAVLLRFRVPEDSEALTARGRVSWCEDPPAAAEPRFLEAGVRFEVMSDADRGRLQSFVRSCDPSG